MSGARRPSGVMVEAPGQDGPNADNNQKQKQEEEKQNVHGGNRTCGLGRVTDRLHGCKSIGSDTECPDGPYLTGKPVRRNVTAHGEFSIALQAEGSMDLFEEIVRM